MTERLPNIGLEFDVHRDLRKYCKKKMIVMHQLVNKLLRNYLDKPEVKKYIDEKE